MPVQPNLILRCVLTLILAVGTVAFASGAEPTGGPVQIDPAKAELAWKLARELNSDAYKVRTFARNGLLVLGRASIEPLEFAAKSDESESRLAAVELLLSLRGRGLLGIDMQQPFLVEPPPSGVVVQGVRQGMPAEQAGIQAGDLVLEINGESVPDQTGLQHLVFAAGPACVIDVVVQRGDEKLHVPVVLTLNVIAPPMSNVLVPYPPVNLESELPPSDNLQARDEANARALLFLNQPAYRPAPPPAQPSPENPQLTAALEAALQKVKEEAKAEKK